MMNEVKLHRRVRLNATYEQAKTLHLSLCYNNVKNVSAIMNAAIVNKQHMEIEYMPLPNDTNIPSGVITSKLLNEGNLVSNIFITLILEYTIPLFDTDINEHNIKEITNNIEASGYAGALVLARIGDKVWSYSNLISMGYSKYVTVKPAHDLCGVCFDICNEYGDYITVSKDMTVDGNSFNVTMFPSRDNFNFDNTYRVTMINGSEEESSSNLLGVMKKYLTDIDINSIRRVPLQVYLAGNTDISVLDNTVKGYKYDENSKQVYSILNKGVEDETRCIASSIRIINKFDANAFKDGKSLVYTDCSNKDRFIVLRMINNVLAVEVFTK